MVAIHIMAHLHPSVQRDERLRLTYLYGGNMRYQPGEILDQRVLTDFEMVLITEGQPAYEANGQRHRLQPGSLVLARPGFLERYTWDHKHCTRHAFFHFGIETIPSSWPQPDDWPVARRRTDEVVEALFRSVLGRSQHRGDPFSGSPPRLDTQLVESLIELFLDEPDGSRPLLDAERPEPVVRALQWMRHVLEEEPNRATSLSDLAQKAGVCPKHLCRVFSQSVGHSPMETLRLLRLQLGIALLVRSSLTVKEIAARCGFSDPLYFSRCFSTTFGCSPSQVREDVKQGRPPPRNPLPVDVTPRVHW